ncbi:MAG: 30S ribosomal protein S7 [Anaerolineae bacterium]|nr:30S ribosomal protein S7 [Anaerolineae bacterium]
MPRRGHLVRREVVPDPRFQSVVVSQFINKIMERGKKSLAQRLFYDAMELMEERTKKPALPTFEQAMRNATPMIEVKPRRVGGSTYQVPIEIRPDRRNALAIRWLIQSARNRPGKTFSEKLAGELLDAASNQGATIRRREETHKMAEANKAYAHYRW